MATFFNFRRRHQPENITPDRLTPDEESYFDGDLAAMEALNTLKEFEKLHHLDPNLPLDELIEIDAAINAANPEKGVEIEQILVEDNSPYPEVGFARTAHPFSFNLRSCSGCNSWRIIHLTQVLSRFERPFGITMSRYRSIRSAHG
jgi:hypothetical protein